jgi:hypothetical protein
VWSTSGDGTFGNPNSLTTTYTPGLQDIINGSVSITLTSTSPYWNWPCSQVSDSFILTIDTPPIVDAGPDQVICPNEIVNLSGTINGAANNINWSGGSGIFYTFSSVLNATYVPTPSEIISGSFILTLNATDSNGACGVVSDDVLITINQVQIVNNISASSCDFYVWNGITYTESGIYQYQGSSLNGCDSIVNLDLTIYDDLVEPIIDISNTVELSSMNQSNVSYQWVVCPDYTPIANATSNNFTATTTGEYALIVSNLCGSDTSNCVEVSISGIYESEQNSLLVYPNPVSNEFYIDYPGVIKKFEIQDLNGKIILQSNSPDKTNTIPASISDGIYFLKVYTTDRIIGEKLVIEKR